MVKAVGLLIVGSLLGAGTMYFVIGAGYSASQGEGASSLLASVAASALGTRPAAEAISVSESLAVYRSAAEESDPAAIERELATAASEAWSSARTVKIDALIARLSELAPSQAARLARDLGLETNFIADAFLNWAEVDPDAALRELHAIDDAVTKRAISLALLDVFGDDSAGFDRVSAGLPRAERESLRVDWLAGRAEFDPVGAFREAQALFDTDLTRRALQRIAAAWAEQDPASALSQADLLPDPLGSIFRSSVFSEWARLDGAGFLAWLESVNSPPNEAVSGIRMMAISSPERLMQIVDRNSGSQWQAVRTNVMFALAELNPEAAMERVAALPAGPERETVLMAIGTALARSSPDEAIAWAQALSPPSPNLMQQITMAIAMSDPSRALAFIDNPPAGMDPQLIASIVVSVASQAPGQARVLADQLIARDNIQNRNALRNLIGNWMRQDPERALEWILVHDDQVNAGVLGTAAQSFARSDPVAAASFLDRIPAEYRSAWIAQVAMPFALNDPAAALAWVAQFQGQDVYDDALRGVIAGSARVDPRRAAELLSQASDDVQLGSARQVAQLWAATEPRAAAVWAADLPDDRIRASAVAPVVNVWAEHDPSAARNWTLDLEQGETRDEALNALLSRTAATGDFDRSLLTAYSSDPARQEALRRVIPGLAQSNPDEADALLDLVTNAATRRELEQRIVEQNARR